MPSQSANVSSENAGQPGSRQSEPDLAAVVAKENGFSGKKAAQICGITYRQLDYWARTDLVRPSLADAKGSGSRRLYSYSDLLVLKVIKKLLDAGIKLEQVRNVFSYMTEAMGEDVTTANLVIEGPNAVMIRTGEEIVDVLRQGQGVLNVLPLAGVKHELEAAILEFGGQDSSADQELRRRHG